MSRLCCLSTSIIKRIDLSVKSCPALSGFLSAGINQLVYNWLMSLSSHQAAVHQALDKNAEPADRLVIGVSSRALFNLDRSHQVYENEGLAAYQKFQIKNEEKALEPGCGYHLVRKLLRINELLDGSDRVDVVLLSRNTADTGLRVFNSIEKHNLNIKRAAFCGGDSPHRYIQPFGVQLFLSAEADDVRQALNSGVPAATLLPVSRSMNPSDQICIAFDGDAVLFSDEAERIYQRQGLDAFVATEQAKADQPLGGGPFKPFLTALHGLQNAFGEKDCPIRTALITARSAPTHKRVVRTLRAWGIRLNESIFLGGLSKKEFLQSFGADIFFDDQERHCMDTHKDTPTGHVPSGVLNEA